MAEPGLSESAWTRGWSDTKHGLGTWQFWALEVFGGGLMAIFVSPAAALIFVLGMVVAMWIGATVSAPTRQRDETRKYLMDFEEKPLVIQFDPAKHVVMHESGRAGTFRIEVKNTGPKTVLGVGVQIVDLGGEKDDLTREYKKFIGLKLAVTLDPSIEIRGVGEEKPNNEVNLAPNSFQIFDLARLTSLGSNFLICHSSYELKRLGSGMGINAVTRLEQVPRGVISAGRLEIVLRAVGQDATSENKRLICEPTDETISMREG